MNKYLFSFFLFIVFAVFSGSSTAYAQEANRPKNFSKIEGTGIYQSSRSGSLGDGVWDRSSRADVAYLIERMPMTSESLAVQGLIKAILLGESNTRDLDDAKNVTEDTDLLTLRLEKLLEGGFYRDASQLYAQIDEGDLYPAVMRLGLLAALGSGEKSIACLDAKSLADKTGESDFWSTFKAYCDYTLSDAPSDALVAILEKSPYDVVKGAALGSKYMYDFDAHAFDQLSKLEQAVLISGGFINAPELSLDDVSRLSSIHVAALLSANNLSDDGELYLQLRALQLGLNDSKPLERLYAAADKSSDSLAGLYKQAKDPDVNTNVGAVAQEALNKTPQYLKFKAYAFIPFLPFVEKMDLRSLNTRDMRTILAAYYYSGGYISSQLVDVFVDNIDAISDEENISPQNEGYKSLSYALYSLAPDSKRSKISNLIHKISSPASDVSFFTFNVIENLDKSGPGNDNAATVYEKDFVLTSDGSYTMPSWDLWGRFDELSQNKVIGETVLLSIFILHNQRLKDLYPGLIADVVESFNNLGLKPIPVDLMLEGLIGN